MEFCKQKFDKYQAMQIKRNIAVSETGFVFDPTSGESYSINRVGQEIIALLKEGKAPEEISATMCGEYEIDPAGFEKYYYDFIGMLKQFQLIEEDV